LATLDALPVVDDAVIAPLYETDLRGDAAFLTEVVQAFRDDTPPRIATIREANAERSVDALVHAAHALKGSSGNFGAARMQALCVEIEQRGRAGAIDDLTP